MHNHAYLQETAMKESQTHKKLMKIDLMMFASLVVLIATFFIVLQDDFDRLLKQDDVFVTAATDEHIEITEENSLSTFIVSDEKISLKTLPVQKPTTVPVSSSYLIMGDSMMQYGIGSVLENALLESNVATVRRLAVQSTGLLHPNRLDWYLKADELLDQEYADVVIVMFGLNDIDHMFDKNGIYQTFGTDEWRVAYAEKVDEMLYKLLVEHNVKKVIWVGLPIARDKYWNDRVLMFNDIFENVVDRYLNAVYVDSYSCMAGDDGLYSPVATDMDGVTQIARQDDGLHVTLHGGKIMSDLILDAMRQNDISF